MPPESIAPPIGLIPEKFWKEERVTEILAAMARYTDANMVIPKEWIIELTGLIFTTN